MPNVVLDGQTEVTVQQEGTVSQTVVQDSQRSITIEGGETLDPTLIHYWKFDQSTGADSYGGLTLEHSSSPVWVDGIRGKAINFNGTGTSLSCSDETLPLDREPRTCSFWFKMTALPNTNELIVFANWGRAESNCAFGIGILNIEGVQNFRYFGWDNDMDTPVSLSVGVWYHLTITYDGLTARIYLNGELIDVSNRPDWQTFSDGLFYAGVILIDGISASMNGALDEIRLYNRALDDTEVLTLYQSYV